MRPRNALAAARRDERGGVLVFIAFALPVLILVVAFVIDIGNWLEHRRHLQLQADAAAFAGGLEFQKCIASAATGNDAIIRNALAYAGLKNPVNPSDTAPPWDTSVSTDNGQVGVSGSEVVLASSRNGGAALTDYFNSRSYAAGGTADADTVEENPCAPTAMALDVKLSDHGLPVFFGLLPFKNLGINAHARVELQPVQSENDIRPIAVRDDSAYQCGQAQFFAVDPTTGNPTGSAVKTLTLTKTLVNNGAIVQFANAGEAISLGTASLTMRVVLGDCAGSNDTFADPTGGVSFVNVYSTGSSPNGAPVVHSVRLSGSPCTAQSETGPVNDPYFFTSDCTVTVKAYVDFPGSPIYVNQGANKQNAFITIGGVDAVHGSDAGGDYWTASFTYAGGDGPKLYNVSWRKEYGTVGATACGNGQGKNPAPCTGTFGYQQQAFAATDDDDQPVNSGPLTLVQITQTGAVCPGGPHTCPKNTTPTLGVKVQLPGLANSLPTDPPIVLRFPNQGSARTGVVDCGWGNGASDAYNGIRYGCKRPLYLWPTGTACVAPSTTPPGATTPIDCVDIVPGNRRNQVINGFIDKINGACNNWNAYRADPTNPATQIKVGDPRAFAMIITSPANLSGKSNGPPVPVLGFAEFYVTGWDNGKPFSTTGCSNEPPPGGKDKFAVWGHWIKYIPPPGSGTGTGAICDLTKFGNCIPVLTR